MHFAYFQVELFATKIASNMNEMNNYLPMNEK